MDWRYAPLRTALGGASATTKLRLHTISTPPSTSLDSPLATWLYSELLSGDACRYLILELNAGGFGVLVVQTQLGYLPLRGIQLFSFAILFSFSLSKSSCVFACVLCVCVCVCV